MLSICEMAMLLRGDASKLLEYCQDATLLGNMEESRIVVVEAHALMKRQKKHGRPSAPKRACMWRSWREAGAPRDTL